MFIFSIAIAWHSHCKCMQGVYGAHKKRSYPGVPRPVALPRLIGACSLVSNPRIIPNKKRQHTFSVSPLLSGWADLNRRPLDPQSSTHVSPLCLILYHVINYVNLFSSSFSPFPHISRIFAYNLLTLFGMMFLFPDAPMRSWLWLFILS